jgi:glycosyltransferase involved in cell wall biosynthesis
MKISVVTTVLNEEKNIVQFLDSIVNQTKKPDEIIVVDGGSKDSTIKILKKYQKKNRLVKVYELPNSKISEGRNFGVKNSK